MRAWIFSYRPRRLRMVSQPVLHHFGDRRFIFRPRGKTFEMPLAFEWEALDSTLPSLRGEIVLHRFGPFVFLVVTARLQTARDVVGRLLRESVGVDMTSRSLHFLTSAIHRAISTAPRQIPAHR